MSQIHTFLGKGGTGRSTLAVAAARAAAQQGKRVLLVGNQPGSSLDYLLEKTLSTDPLVIAANLSAVQLRSTTLLEQGWTQIKEWEARYVRTPFFKDIYAQELPILPGMDQALGLDAVRRFDSSGQYDTIIYDGSGDLATLRALGIPEVASWYWRRLSKAFLQSELAKTLRTPIELLIRSVSTVDFSGLDDLPNQMGGMPNGLEQGRQVISNPQRVLAHLVTSSDPMAVQTAKYLWGSAQMIGVTVGSVLVSPLANGSVPAEEFSPLPIHPMPPFELPHWGGLETAVNPIFGSVSAPPPVAFDEQARQVRLFIPGFSKGQIELSQSGPELTLTAGDQRRNLSLPPSLSGRQVTGAKFQYPYLIISFG